MVTINTNKYYSLKIPRKWLFFIDKKKQQQWDNCSYKKKNHDHEWVENGDTKQEQGVGNSFTTETPVVCNTCGAKAIETYYQDDND